MDYTPENKYSVFRCCQCGEFLYSKYRGHFSSCSCRNFIDQTEYYSRMGGNFKDFEYYGTVEDIIDGPNHSINSITPAGGKVGRKPNQ